MKKIISTILLLTIFLGTYKSVYASELTIYAAYGSPIIGETIDPKWDSIEAVEMNGVKKAGNSDSSGIFKVMYDSRFLYVLAVINDMTHFKKSTAYDSDSIEIFIDQANDKTYENTDDNDFNVRITRDKENDESKDRTEKYEVVSTDTGYIVQAAIKIDIQYLKEDGKIGFDIQFNDAIETGLDKDKALGWTSNNDAYRYANERGTLILLPGPDSATEETTVTFGTPVIGETIDPKWDCIEAIEMKGVKKAGNNDSSGSFKVMRDHKYLYVLADIKDNTPYKKATAFDSDSIEIFIDQTNDKTFMDVNEDDFTVRITRDKENDLGGDRIGKYEVISDKNGYIVQVSIKIDAKYMIDHGKIGFDIQFNDAVESGNSKDKAMGWTSNNDAYRYANERGTLILLDSPEIIPHEIAYVKYGTPKIGQTIDPKWGQIESIPLIGERKTGNGKSSGSFKVMRDGKYLYVLVEVKDDTPFTKVTTYNSDGIEIYIDQANDKTIESIKDDDFNICITRENDLDQTVERVSEYDVISWNEGYIVQAAIIIDPQYMIDNGKIGFDIQVNDAVENGLEKDRVFGWTPNADAYRYANERGTLILLDKSTLIDIGYDNEQNSIKKEPENNVLTSDNNLFFPLTMTIILPFVIVLFFGKKYKNLYK